MKKPIKPERKYKRLTIRDRPDEPSKIKTVVAYRTPSTVDNECDGKWDTLSDKEKIDVLSFFSLDDLTFEALSKYTNIDICDDFLEVVKEATYYPSSLGDISLADITANIPDNVHPEDINISVDRYYEDNGFAIYASYETPNNDYDKEMHEYQAAYAKFEEHQKLWKEENAVHKERLKKYKEDNKKYKEWRENRIKDLEAAGEL